jgi:hypothetical protein
MSDDLTAVLIHLLVRGVEGLIAGPAIYMSVVFSRPDVQPGIHGTGANAQSPLGVNVFCFLVAIAGTCIPFVHIVIGTLSTQRHLPYFPLGLVIVGGTGLLGFFGSRAIYSKAFDAEAAMLQSPLEGAMSMATVGQTPAPAGDVLGANTEVERRVRGALSVADFAVSAGFTSSEDEAVPTEIISVIQTTAVKLGFFKQPGFQGIGAAGGAVSAAEWAKFEIAYYKLATLVRPVNAETLRDTETEWGYSSTSPRWYERLSRFLLGASPAVRFTRCLWIVAIVFVLFVIMTDWAATYAAREGNQNDWTVKLSQFLQILVPYAFGGLGACAYLLRSAHKFIYLRTFDVRRKPEYYNRILLGTIAGGAIMLFVSKATGDDDTTLQLGPAALGFIAGYSTDFLFNKIQSIIGVLLPKGDDGNGDTAGAGSAAPVRKAPTPPDLTDLANRHDKAARAEDKEFYKDLIRHAAGGTRQRAPVRSNTRGKQRTDDSETDEK